MTRDANPDEPSGSQVLAQFLQDWTRLFQQELQAQKADPAAAFGGMGSPPDMSAAMELWRSTMGVWAQTLGVQPATSVGSRERTGSSRPAAAAAAPDARDAEIERLARRVDELEARLAKLESPRRRRG
jgi:hypothetical protein